MSTHTNTPWAVAETSPKGEFVIYSLTEYGPGKSQRKTVGHFIGDKANAEFIVRTVNSHQALVASAKEVMALLEAHGGSIVPHLLDTDMNAGQRLRDAIAAAEVGQ